MRSRTARIESDIERESKRIEFFDEKKKRAEADRNELLEDVLHLRQELEEIKARLGELEGARGDRAEVDRLRDDLAAARKTARAAAGRRSAGCGTVT